MSTSISDRHHFHPFGNKEMTALHVTLAFLHFGEGLISVFVPIYFWGLGFSLGQIILFYLLWSVYFVSFTLIFLSLIKRLSDKMMMFISIPFTIFYFLGLGYLEQAPTLFYILPGFMALSSILFNNGYHISFAAAADDGYIGRQIGMRYVVASAFQLTAPFIGGILIGISGFQNTFMIGSVILFLSILPLFFFPRRHVAEKLQYKTIYQYLKQKEIRPFNILGFGYATEKMIEVILWPLFIFLAIGSVEQLGGVISFGLLAGAISTYFVGVLSDIGKRRKILSWATGLFSLIWASRAVIAKPFLIISNHIGGGLVRDAATVSWSSQFYKIARAVDDPGAFILSREILYHLSRILFLPVLILLSLLLPQGNFFSVSFILAAALTLLYLSANKLHTRDLSNFLKSAP